MAVGLALGAGALAVAAIPDSTTGVISACLRTRDGSIRIIDAQAGRRCTAGETLLTWNQKGATGATGAPGPQGAAGPAGAAGATGAQGEAGVQGPQGDQGVEGAPGPKGDPGPAGPQGLPGTDGVQGPKGDPGPAGPSGSLSCSDELRIHAAVPAFEVRAECVPQPMTVFDNLGPTPTSGGVNGIRGATYEQGGYNDVAAGFVPVTSTSLESLTVRLSLVAGGDVTVSLVPARPLTGFGTSDATTEPDDATVLESWTLTATSSTPTEYTLNSVAHPLMEAGQQYWFVMKAASSTTYVQWWISSSAPGGQLLAERNAVYATWGYPVTAWKSVVVNETHTMRIVGRPT